MITLIDQMYTKSFYLDTRGVQKMPLESTSFATYGIP